MLNCVAMIARITGIENRKSSVVLEGWQMTSQSRSNLIRPQVAGDVDGALTGDRPEKAILEGSAWGSNKRKLQRTCFVVTDSIIWNF